MNDLSALLSRPALLLNGIDKERSERHLIDFLESAWPYIDPSPFIPGWHLTGIAEHLEAVNEGEILRLIVNVPPRSGKSTLLSVAWPVWTWLMESTTPLFGPEVQFFSASYAQNLSTRDALKARRLINSPWFQQKWADRFQLTGDQNAKMRYENNKGGYRIASSVGGGATGEGGSIVLIDDAASAGQAQSEADRLAVIEWWDQTMSTRLNNPKTGAYVVVQQRLHTADLTGHILETSNDDWVHLCLPARYEADRHCVTSIGWEDPRKYTGEEILSPARFDDKALRALEESLGPFGTAGQLQQRPSPAGGGIIKNEWWQLWGDYENPDNPRYQTYPAFDYIVASLDTAFTEKEENDPSALAIWGVFSDTGGTAQNTSEGRVKLGSYGIPRALLMWALKERLPLHELVEVTAKWCRKFKVDRLLIEAKANGISVAQEMERLYDGERWSVELIEPKGDKVARVYAIAPLFSAGMIYAPFEVYDLDTQEWRTRRWCDRVISEFSDFPKAPHDDEVDASSQALSWLKRAGMLKLGSELSEDIGMDSYNRGGRPKPLYPS